MENIIRNDKRQKLNREITGVIQNDRIWEQWYNQEIFNYELPKMSLYFCSKTSQSSIKRGLEPSFACCVICIIFNILKFF